MIQRMTGVLTATLLAAGVPCALAQAPEMPKPAPEMAAIAFFNGSWTCQGTMKPSPFGPGGAISSTSKIHDDLGGFWQSGKVESSMGDMKFQGRFHTTYDSAAKEYLMLWVDSMGAWSQSTSKGWSGDTIVYEGEGDMGGQKMEGRDTFTKSGPDGMKHSWEMKIEGKWTPMGEETCKKGK